MEPLSEYEREPGMYPYPRPKTSYLLAETEGGIVLALHPAGPGPAGILESELDSGKKINKVLYELKASPLEKRIPVVGYGSNANPTVLTRKFRRRGLPINMPVFKGSARGFDIVYSAYVSKAFSIPAQAVHSEGTEPEVWLTLLDEEQLIAMHDTEGLKKGTYFLGLMPFMAENNTELNVFCYFGGSGGTFTDPEKDEPIALASSGYKGDGNLVVVRDFIPVDAKNRRFGERTQKEMMNRFNEISLGEFSEPIYESPGVLTEWGKENRLPFNDHLKEKYGRVLPINTERVESPYEASSLKKLGDF